MLEWIISSTVLILIVIALRLILKGKISLRLQYALWAIVLLRLIIPVSFGSSIISIGNLTQKAAETEAGQIVSALSDTELPSKTYRAAYDEVAKEYAEKGVDISEIPAMEFSETIDYEIMERMNGSRSIRDIIQIVWIIGIAAVGLVLISSNIRFAVKLKKSRQRLEGQSVGLPLYVSPNVDTPCLFGLFHPAIYLTPEAAADDTVLRHSIQHELTHFRHGDHIWSILRGVCLALHWYNPLVWWTAALSRNDAELACDEATIRRIGENERSEYGRTLIEMTCQKRPALLLTATTMTGSKNSIRERITMIAKKPKTAVYTLVSVILIAAVAVGCTFMGAKEGLNAPEPFGHSYRVSAVLYDAPQFDFYFTAETAPGYLFTNDYAMYDTLWSRESDYWRQIQGGFEEVKLSPLVFDDYFKNDGVSGWRDTPFGSEKIRLDTKQAWRFDVESDENNVFYYLILTHSGEVYLTYGYDVGEEYAAAEDGSLIRWLFRLERTDFISCHAISENCNALVEPTYYPNGFDWDYDSLPSGPINDKGTLIFTADYDTDTLMVGEDYYRKIGADSTFIERNTYELSRNADGKFELQVARKGETQEHAYYFVKGETGVYVFKIIFGNSSAPIRDAEDDALLAAQAWPLAEEYAEVNRLDISQDDYYVFRYTDGKSADVIFPEADREKSVQVSFMLNEDGSWAPLPVNAVNMIERDRWDSQINIQVIEENSNTEESSYRVGAILPGTDFSSISQMLEDKITQEWNTHDGMTKEALMLSSRVWGLVYYETDTWNEFEETIGLTVKNPLESLSWLNKTGYIGMESADQSTPIKHIEVTADTVTERKLNEIRVTSGYNTESARITLTATLSASEGTYTTGSVYTGYATYKQNTATTGSGIPVLIVITDGTNNIGYYNGDYYDPTAYWVKDNVFYTLRVIGDSADKDDIQATLDRILAEI